MKKALWSLVTFVATSSLAHAAPLTGDALDLVNRLTRAGGISIPVAVYRAPDATSRIAARVKAAGRCLSEPTLTMLAAKPRDPGAQAVVVLVFRCITSVGGAPLNPQSALSMLQNLGFDLTKSGGLEALLNNPPAMNTLRKAALRPVTPLTPNN